MISEQELESENFDPIAYINKKFPNEESLENLDQEIDQTQQRIDVLEKGLMKSIETHALVQDELKKETQESKKAAIEIMQEVKIIKSKAEKSEELVEEMCKDIRALDIAKKNLTFSITSLKKFLMMLTALEKLRESCKIKDYKEVSNLLSALEDLLAYFKNYETIPQLSQLLQEKNKLLQALEIQLQEEFSLFLKNIDGCLQSEQMKYACKSAEFLGLGFQRKIVIKICEESLKGYTETFTGEQGSLQNIERRFNWVLRKRVEYEQRLGKIIPHYWALPCYIYNEFCSNTLIHLSQILHSPEGQQQMEKDINVLIQAIQVTMQFEEKIYFDMKKEFGEYRKSSENVQISITDIPKFKGSISKCFQGQLDPYLNKERDDLQKNILQFIEKDSEESSGDLKVLNSSLFLFNYLKALLKRSLQIIQRDINFEQIVKIIRNGLQEYKKNLEIKIQNIQPSKIEYQIPFYINTAEYCKETIQALLESVQRQYQSNFQQQIQVNFDKEEDNFAQFLHYSINQLINGLMNRVENQFLAFQKMSFDKIKAQDSSECAKNIKAITHSFCTQVFKNINSLYYSFFLTRLADRFVQEMLKSVYKLRKISEEGVQQIQFDLYLLKEEILQLEKQATEQNQQGFLDQINKTFKKSEDVLKIIITSNDEIQGKFLFLLKGLDPSEIEKILMVKGIKKVDVVNVLKSLNNN